MKCSKQHRYVSTSGPSDKPREFAFTHTMAQAIARAENEGWPIAAAGSRAPLATRFARPVAPLTS